MTRPGNANGAYDIHGIPTTEIRDLTLSTDESKIFLGVLSARV